MSRTACNEHQEWGDGHPDPDGHFGQHGRHGPVLEPDYNADPGYSNGLVIVRYNADTDAGMRFLPRHPAGDRAPLDPQVAFLQHLPRHGLQLFHGECCDA